MRKKITALSLLLLSMIGFTANAELTYTWSIEEGSSVESFSEVTLTISGIDVGFEGNYGSNNECGLYKADGTQLSTFGWSWCPYSLEIVDGSVSFTLPVQSDAVYPDYPVTTKGDYYVKIQEGYFRTFPEGSENGENVPELRLNFSIDPVAGFVSESDVTITPAAGILKSCPAEWVITINKDDVTKTELTEDARFVFYANSWTQYELIPTISEDGKTITLAPGADEYGEQLVDKFASLNAGTYRLIIFKNSLKFNDDDTKTNDLIQVYYEIPEVARYNKYQSYPQEGKVSKLDKLVLYFYDSGATVEAAEAAEDLSNVCHIQYFDQAMGMWYPVVFYQYEIIPSEKDPNYDSWSYPGVKLTLMEGYENMTFPAGEYKLVCPSAAFVVTTRETDWEASQVKESQYFEMAYTVETAPAITCVPTFGFEDGAVFGSFSETTVTFAGCTSVEYIDEYDDSTLPVLYRIEADGSETQIGTLNFGVYDESIWGDVIEPTAEGTFPLYMRENKFEPYYPMDMDGDYKIVVKENCLMFDGFNDIVNEAASITFKIQNTSLLKQEYASIDPTPCEISDYPEKLVITFENDAIETLEIGLVETRVGWDSENGCDIYEMLPAKLECIMAYDNYSWVCGQYIMEINPENTKQIICTPDPSSISADAQFPYGNYMFRIPRGGVIANKGLETECVNSIVEFGYYTHPQRWTTTIASPNAAEEQTSLFGFAIDLTDDYGYNVYDNYAGLVPTAGANPAQLFVYDEVRAEWSHYSDLVLAQNEAGQNYNEDGKVEFQLPYYPVETSGRYKVVIPNDAVKFDYYGSIISNMACEAEYVLKSDVAPYTVETDPAEGDVPFIDDIKLTFTDSWMSGAYIYAWPYENGAAAFNAEGELVAYANMSTEYAEDWSMYHLIDFEPAITELGEYRVVVANNVICTDYDGIGDNESFSFNFNVIGGDPVLSVSPADGATVEDLSKFSFSWAGATSLEVNSDLAEGAKLYSVVEGENVLVANLTAEAIDHKNAVLQVADKGVEMANGEYVLEVPAELFKVNGKANETMTFNYTLAAVVLNVTEVEAPFAKLHLTAENCSEIKVNDGAADQIALYFGENKVGTYTVENIVENTCDLVLSEGVELLDGEYFVVIPEGYFWVDNDMNKQAKFAFVYTSVESIVGDSNFDVYGVNGMIIKRNADKADVKDLDPGIYVINGKKVIVK